MAYCTAANLYDRAREETVKDWITDSADGPEIDILDQAIEWADNEINQSLYNLYSDSLPFASVPYAIVNIAVDFAIYWLATRAQAAADTYKDNYKDARARLLRIAEGKEPLITPDGEKLSAADSIAPDEAESLSYSTTEGQSPIFTRSNPVIARLMQY